jgi:hypothetical protein
MAGFPAEHSVPLSVPLEIASSIPSELANRKVSAKRFSAGTARPHPWAALLAGIVYP